jgi:peptidase M28-like protein
MQRPSPLTVMLGAMLALVPAVPLLAQTSPAIRDAASTIAAADVARRIGIIADDSMMGRDTPSPGLEMTAAYVADQFKRFGLKPAGDQGSFVQRYKITRRHIDPAASQLEFMFRGQRLEVSLEKDARYAFGGVADSEVIAPAVLLGGAFTSADVDRFDPKGKAILVLMDYSKPLSGAVQQTIIALYEQGAAGIVLLSNRDSATFAQRVSAQAMQVASGVEGLGSQVAVVEVHQRALAPMIAAYGLKLDEVRAASPAVVKPLDGLEVGFALRNVVLESASAPNTVGLLEGSDPKLRNEYLIYSAHMDHIGISRGKADSINNGADDDGSGTAGVMELAEAFSQKGARPRRSLIFLTVSGEEKGLYGSAYFTEHPPVPLSSVVADLNIDMIGRNWKDTIVAIGKEHSDLGATLNRVNAAHPELNMAAIDDRWPQENFYSRSDHYNFARKGVPILFFFNGVHADYHQPSDSPDKIDAEKESRILRLLFYLGEDIANNPERPKWNPDSYHKIVEMGGG